MFKTLLVFSFLSTSLIAYAGTQKDKACRKGHKISCEGFKSAKREYFCTKWDPSKISSEKKQKRCEKPKKKRLSAKKRKAEKAPKNKRS